MKKRQKNITENGFTSENGVCFGNDITLNYTGDHNAQTFSVIRIIIAFLATASVMCMFGSFIEILPNYSVVIAFSLISVISMSMIKSNSKAFRFAGFALIISVLIYFLLSYEKVSQGFYVTVYQYLRHANQPSSILGSSLNGVERELYPYLASIFIMFMSTVIGLLISVSCIFKLDFPLMFVITFPLFELGMYWGWEPPMVTLLILFICWIAVLTMHSINHTTNKAGRQNTFAVHERKRTYYFTSETEKSRYFPVLLRYVLILTAGIFAVIIIFTKVTGYERSEQLNTYRRNISNAINNFTLSDISNAFSDYDGGLNIFGVKSVGGTNGGVLGRTAGISFNGSTSLKVTTSQFGQTMYLRGYIAGKYEDNCWNVVDYEDSATFAQQFSDSAMWPQDYDYNIFRTITESNSQEPVTTLTSSADSNLKSIDVNVKSASKKFVYAPYTAHYSGTAQVNDYKMKPQFDSYVKLGTTQYSIDYCNVDNFVADSWSDITTLWDYSSDKSQLTTAYEEFIAQNYTEVTESDGLDKAYDEIVANYLGDDRSYTSVYNAISSYFNENYEYSLTPGITPDGEDFVDYFLTTQKKGFCTYYASAGAQLMRKFGYPARYAEGYMVLPTQYNANLADEDGRYEISVKDKSAHAWTEVYLDGIGWYPAEFTPGYHNDNPNLTEKEKNPSQEPVQTTLVTSGGASTEPVDTSSDKGTETALSSQSASNSNTSEKSSDTDKKPNSSKDNSNNAYGEAGSLLSSDTSGTGTAASLQPDESSKKTANALIFAITVLLAFAAFMALRRSVLLKEKQRKCSSDNNTESVKAILVYTLSYLSLIGIETKRNTSDMQICYLLIEKLNKRGIVIDNELEYLFELAEKAYMSNSKISDEEREKAQQFMDMISENVVRPKLNHLQMLAAKFGSGLY